MSLESYLDELSHRDVPLSSAKLSNLSALSRNKVALVQRAWPGIEVERRRLILEELTNLAEYDVELDFEAIYRIALNDEDDEVRSTAIEVLWECEDRSLIDPLITLMRQDRSEVVRAAAAAALGRFVLLAEFEELSPKDAAKVETALFSTLEDKQESVEVRRRAIEAISALSRPTVKEIIRQAYQGSDPSLKAGALYAMGRNFDPVWLPTLITELASDDPEMRFEAASACGELEDERAVPYLVLLAHDDDDQVQGTAIAALGRIGGDEAKRELERLLNDSNEMVQIAAAEALQDLEFEGDPLSSSHEV